MPGAAERLRSALGRVGDWEGLHGAALQHGMGALLYDRARRLCPDAVPDDALSAWREQATRTARRSLRQQRRLAVMLAALREAGVDAVAFKGAALSCQAYGDSTLRASLDIDLLVPRAQAFAGREVALSLGYEDAVPLGGVSLDTLLVSMQEVVVVDAASHAAVELHWRVGPRFAAESVPAESVVSRSGSVELLGRAVRTPAPADAALLVAVHAATHDWRRFEDVAAFAGVARRLDAASTAALEARARRYGCARRVHVATLLGLTLAGAGMPQPLAAAARADRRAKDLAAFYGARLIGDMATATPRGRTTPSARAHEVLREARLLDSPRATASYVWRRLAVPAVDDLTVAAGDADRGSRGAPAGARARLALQVRRQRRLWRL